MPNLETYVISIERASINWRDYVIPFYAIHLSPDFPVNTNVTVNRLSMAVMLRPYLTGVAPGSMFRTANSEAAAAFPGVLDHNQSAEYDNVKFEYEYNHGNNGNVWYTYPGWRLRMKSGGAWYTISFSKESSGYGNTFQPAVAFFRGVGYNEALSSGSDAGAYYTYNFPEAPGPSIAISAVIPGIDASVLTVDTTPPLDNPTPIKLGAAIFDLTSMITATGSDPYNIGGVTGPGGATGDWRIVNDPIDFPTVPTISVAEAGFVAIWTPELSELRRLASFMWCADPLKIDFWKQMITNPIDLILGLQLLPFDIPAEGVGRVTLGLIDSKIDMHYTDQQFHEIDCGELELAEYWGAFLDYGPFTSLDIYLPYIGVRTLNINDCMPKTIHVKYYVDIVTGTCVAMVKCDDSLFYHFNGSCASQVPVTSGQAQQLFGQALGAAMKIAAGAATGGIAGALASTVGVASAAAQSGGTAGADRSGTISGTAGFMDTQTPYLIVTRPRQAVPEAQNELTGYPSFINAQLGDLEGYTEVQVAHLHNMSCTAAEVEEITQLLQEGVIF